LLLSQEADTILIAVTASVGAAIDDWVMVVVELVLLPGVLGGCCADVLGVGALPGVDGVLGAAPGVVVVLELELRDEAVPIDTTCAVTSIL
jgi:hypothetical protein